MVGTYPSGYKNYVFIYIRMFEYILLLLFVLEIFATYYFMLLALF
jgi:hypothetical protein